jgi:hypothetical protein
MRLISTLQNSQRKWWNNNIQIIVINIISMTFKHQVNIFQKYLIKRLQHHSTKMKMNRLILKNSSRIRMKSMLKISIFMLKRRKIKSTPNPLIYNNSLNKYHKNMKNKLNKLKKKILKKEINWRHFGSRCWVNNNRSTNHNFKSKD